MREERKDEEVKKKRKKGKIDGWTDGRKEMRDSGEME